MMKIVSPQDLRAEAAALSDGGRRPLSALFGRDETQAGGGYAVYCFFEDAAKRDMEILKAEFAPEAPLSYASLTPDIPAAAWYERELHDMFGIVPEGHPDLRPLVLHESFPEGFHPLRKSVAADAEVRGERRVAMQVARGEGLFEVPVGPIHAGIIEPGHFRFSQAGEAMLQLDAKLFYTHRGLEKAMEGRRPEDALLIVERICGACSIANTWSYCQAIERIAGISVPRRARLIRTLLAELERIASHVGDLGNIPAGVGFSPAVSLGGRTKEQMMRLAERLAGNRFLRGVIVPGGVFMDVTPELLKDIRETLTAVERSVMDIAQMFAEQENFQNRVRTTGIVRLRTARDLAMVGVGARASGFLHDSRRDFSYGCYDELDFPVVTETAGDVAARIAVRVGELGASFAMVRQLAGLLESETDGALRAEARWQPGEGWGISESARGSDFCYVALDGAGRIDRIFVRSASYPNWPALTLAVQGDIIPDFPLINKSFELCYACLDR